VRGFHSKKDIRASSKLTPSSHQLAPLKWKPEPLFSYLFFHRFKTVIRLVFPTVSPLRCLKPFWRPFPSCQLIELFHSGLTCIVKAPRRGHVSFHSPTASLPPFDAVLPIFLSRPFPGSAKASSPILLSAPARRPTSSFRAFPFFPESGPPPYPENTPPPSQWEWKTLSLEPPFPPSSTVV